MRSREPLFRDGAFGDDMADLLPVATPGGSDSATLDNALELFTTITGILYPDLALPWAR